MPTTARDQASARELTKVDTHRLPRRADEGCDLRVGLRQRDRETFAGAPAVLRRNPKEKARQTTTGVQKDEISARL